MSIPRMLAKGMILLVLATSLATVAAGPVQASSLDATCEGTETITFSPGVTLTARQITAHTVIEYFLCDSPSRPAITSARIENTVTTTLSCASLIAPGAAAAVIDWNHGVNPPHSTFSYNRTVTAVGGNTVTTRTGSIVQGLFNGATAVAVNVGPSISLLDCLGDGITSRFGTSTLLITSP